MIWWLVWAVKLFLILLFSLLFICFLPNYLLMCVLLIKPLTFFWKVQQASLLPVFWWQTPQLVKVSSCSCLLVLSWSSFNFEYQKVLDSDLSISLLFKKPCSWSHHKILVSSIIHYYFQCMKLVGGISKYNSINSFY